MNSHMYAHVCPKFCSKPWRCPVVAVLKACLRSRRTPSSYLLHQKRALKIRKGGDSFVSRYCSKLIVLSQHITPSLASRHHHLFRLNALLLPLCVRPRNGARQMITNNRCLSCCGYAPNLRQFVASNLTLGHALDSLPQNKRALTSQHIQQQQCLPQKPLPNSHLPNPPLCSADRLSAALSVRLLPPLPSNSVLTSTSRWRSPSRPRSTVTSPFPSCEYFYSM
ncbi:hypothetical protein IW262DRAFT_1106839 [Armillaria fumosa]|nr:hypothetical protein IW262DRAFT_1106839 [Armillaria fumosa]